MAGVGLTYCIIVRTINWLEFKWGFFFQPVRRTQVQGSNSSHHNDTFFLLFPLVVPAITFSTGCLLQRWRWWLHVTRMKDFLSITLAVCSIGWGEWLIGISYIARASWWCRRIFDRLDGVSAVETTTRNETMTRDKEPRRTRQKMWLPWTLRDRGELAGFELPYCSYDCGSIHSSKCVASCSTTDLCTYDTTKNIEYEWYISSVLLVWYKAR